MGKYIIVTHFLPQNVNLESDAFLKNCSKMENSSKSCKKLNSLSYPASPPKNSFSLETINSIRLSSRKDHGALYSGILSVKDKFECLYVGWLDGYLVDNVLYDAYGLSDITRKRLSSLLNNFGLLPIYLESVLSSEHYDGFSKTRIWPLFHYVLWSPTDGRKEKQYWDSYVEVNQIFADEIIKVYKPGDKIWIHDYHFLLLPMMIRKKVPDAAIGFFLHCPFPSSEIFRCLPVREQILEGMLGSNLIGFHTYSYAKHFISSCVRVLGAESTPKGCEYRDFVSNVGIFPIVRTFSNIRELTLNKSSFTKIYILQSLPKLMPFENYIPEKKLLLEKINRTISKG
jgi:trehalose-6-phosphate synthase